LIASQFVFALWAVRKGKKNLEDIAKKASEILGIDIDISKKYYELLNYNLDHLQLKGLTSFFEKLYHKKILPQKVQLRFFEIPLSTSSHLAAFTNRSSLHFFSISRELKIPWL
jgi:predicted solute-binding protein